MGGSTLPCFLGFPSLLSSTSLAGALEAGDGSPDLGEDPQPHQLWKWWTRGALDYCHAAALGRTEQGQGQPGSLAAAAQMSGPA